MFCEVEAGAGASPPTNYPNRSMAYGAASTDGLSPVASAATISPVTGPSVNPRCWWPKA